MSQVRSIVVGLISASPAILLFDGMMVQGILAGVVGAALAITVCTLPPGETKFLALVTRPLLAVIAIPALWMLIQVLHLRFLAHPFWSSAESALGRSIAGSISINPGATVLALGQYLSVAALVLVSA